MKRSAAVLVRSADAGAAVTPAVAPARPAVSVVPARCVHQWVPVEAEAPGREHCARCPATCTRGKDGRIEIFDAGHLFTEGRPAAPAPPAPAPAEVRS